MHILYAPHTQVNPLLLPALLDMLTWMSFQSQIYAFNKMLMTLSLFPSSLVSTITKSATID